MNNPFSRTVKPPPRQQTQTAPKVDTMREQIKKQLLDAFDITTDGSSKFTSEQLSTEIENQIFEKTGKNSKDKPYREKTKRIIGRVKGARNLIVRNILKSGIFTIDDFCKMTDKELEDDSYFNKYGGEKEQPKSKSVARPPKISVPIVPVDVNNKDNIDEINEYFANNVQPDEQNNETNNVNKTENAEPTEFEAKIEQPLAVHFEESVKIVASEEVIMTEFDNKSIRTENMSVREDIRMISSAVKPREESNRCVSDDPMEKMKELKKLMQHKTLSKKKFKTTNVSIDEGLQKSFADSSKNEEVKSVDIEPVKKIEEVIVEKPLEEIRKEEPEPIINIEHIKPIEHVEPVQVKEEIKEPVAVTLVEQPKSNPFDEEPKNIVKNPIKFPVRPGVVNPKGPMKGGMIKAPIIQKPKAPEIKKIETLEKTEEKEDIVQPNPFDEVKPIEEATHIDEAKPTVEPIKVPTPKKIEISKEPEHNIIKSETIEQPKPIKTDKESPIEEKQSQEKKESPIKEEPKEEKHLKENKEQKIDSHSRNQTRPLQSNIDTVTPFNTPFDIRGNILDINTHQFNPDMDMFSSRIDLKSSFANPLDRSTISVFRDNLDKIKGELRSLKENKHTTETYLDLANKKNEIYEKEIRILRQTVHNLRTELSKTNEEQLKLELSKMSQIVSNKEKENHILIQENSTLKVQFKRLQENFEHIIEENKKFRLETEKKFVSYNQDIEHLKKKCADMAKTIENPPIQIPRNDSFTNGNPNVREDAADEYQMNGNTYDVNGENEGYVYQEQEDYLENREENINNENNQAQYEENVEDDNNYQQDEENYQQDENNYQQDENNYEQDENNYQQEEKDYQQDEDNYQQDENNYEQNYHQDNNEENYQENNYHNEENQKTQIECNTNNMNVFDDEDDYNVFNIPKKIITQQPKVVKKQTPTFDFMKEKQENVFGVFDNGKLFFIQKTLTPNQYLISR